MILNLIHYAGLTLTALLLIIAGIGATLNDT